MQTHVSLPYLHPEPLPDGYVDEVRTVPALAEYALDRWSDPGDVVFDPFAGFGTTLRTAERMDRDPYGLEFEPEKVELIAEELSDPDRIVAGDALALADGGVEGLSLPPVDLAFFSPPFMVEGMETNPFENYDGESDYETYLEDAGRLFAGLADRLAPGGRVVVDVVNMRHDDHVTTLAWDLARAAREHLHFRGETVVAWDGEGDPDRPGAFGYGFDHSYLLAFDAA